MNQENKHFGLKTNIESREIAETKSKLSLAMVDHDYFSNGINYSDVEGVSSNHLFGNGQWKRKMKEAFGEDVFNRNVKMYGKGNAGDFFISKIKTNRTKDFNPGEKIEISDRNNLYSGTYKIIDRTQDGLIVMAPFAGTSSGTIINISRRDGLFKAMKKYNNFLDNSEIFSETSNINNMETPSAGPILVIPVMNDETQQEEQNTNVQQTSETPASNSPSSSSVSETDAKIIANRKIIDETTKNIEKYKTRKKIFTVLLIASAIIFIALLINNNNSKK